MHQEARSPRHDAPPTGDFLAHFRELSTVAYYDPDPTRSYQAEMQLRPYAQAHDAYISGLAQGAAAEAGHIGSGMVVDNFDPGKQEHFALDKGRPRKIDVTALGLPSFEEK